MGKKGWILCCVALCDRKGTIIRRQFLRNIWIIQDVLCWGGGLYAVGVLVLHLARASRGSHQRWPRQHYAPRTVVQTQAIQWVRYTVCFLSSSFLFILFIYFFLSPLKNGTYLWDFSSVCMRDSDMTPCNFRIWVKQECEGDPVNSYATYIHGCHSPFLLFREVGTQWHEKWYNCSVAA